MTAQEDTIDTKPSGSLAPLREFQKLPIEERRRILAEQAEQMVEHYEEESGRRERELWQGGDIVEYYPPHSGEVWLVNLDPDRRKRTQEVSSRCGDQFRCCRSLAYGLGAGDLR